MLPPLPRSYLFGVRFAWPGCKSSTPVCLGRLLFLKAQLLLEHILQQLALTTNSLVTLQTNMTRTLPLRLLLTDSTNTKNNK